MKITGTTNGSWTLVAGKDSGITSLSDLKRQKSRYIKKYNDRIFSR